MDQIFVFPLKPNFWLLLTHRDYFPKLGSEGQIILKTTLWNDNISQFTQLNYWYIQRHLNLITDNSSVDLFQRFIQNLKLSHFQIQILSLSGLHRRKSKIISKYIWKTLIFSFWKAGFRVLVKRKEEKINQKAC